MTKPTEKCQWNPFCPDKLLCDIHKRQPSHPVPPQSEDKRFDITKEQNESRERVAKVMNPPQSECRQAKDDSFLSVCRNPLPCADHHPSTPPQSVCCINCKNPTNFANECCNRDCPCHQPSTPKEECGHHCHEDGRISHCDTCQPQAPQPKEECKHLNTIGYERPNERCLDCGTDLKAPHTAGSEWEKELDKLWLLIPLGNVGKDDFKFLIKKLLASEREKWVINESAEWVKSIELKARSQVLDEAVEATRKIKLAPVMWEGEELLRKYEVLDLLLQLKGQDK